jgi:hypothetical protein
MPANILSSSVDLDTLFAPFVASVVPQVTGYQVSGVDIRTRYDPLAAPDRINAGARVPPTSLTTSASGFAASTDLASIFCGNVSRYSLTTPANGTKATPGGWTTPTTWCHTITMTFASATALTNYFYYGGRILIAPSKVSGTAADNALVTMFASMGTLAIYDTGHYQTGPGGVLTNASIGGSNIGTSSTNLYNIATGGVYTSTTYGVSMVANGAIGLATAITITTILDTVTAGSVADTYTGIYTSNIQQRNHPTQSVPAFTSVMSDSCAVPPPPPPVYTSISLVHTLGDPNAYGTSAGDGVGRNGTIGVSGNYAVVGALLERSAAGANSGAAYVFNVVTGAQLFTIFNPTAFGTQAGDLFGSAVSVSGDFAIIGAYGEDTGSGAYSGVAYIYNVTTGTLVHTLPNPNAYSVSFNDYFASAVAISGNYAVVGAFNEGDAGGGASGKAYIYNVTTGALLFTLNDPNAYGTSSSDNFGRSVSVSGNYAIIGAHLEDDAGGLNSGKAYIFDVTTGALLFTLGNPNAYTGSAEDLFGWDVRVSGDYAIVGAYQEDDVGGTTSGKAYIYNVTTGALLFTLNNPNAYSTSANDRFGYSVDISGNYAIVGAHQEGDAGGTSSGKAYVFNVTTGALVFTLNNPNAYGTSAIDQFGHGVAIDGDYVIVGAYLEDSDGGLSSGNAYIFKLA